jgi:peptide/nickel transport system ATP-binding protein
MYAGKIVEVAPTEELFRQPKMPYTEALLSAVPNPDPAQRQTGRRIQLEGEVADPSDLPSGCSFHPRCRYAEDECAAAEPALEAVASGRDDNHPDRDRHEAACHFADDLDLRGVPAASA